MNHANDPPFEEDSLRDKLFNEEYDKRSGIKYKSQARFFWNKAWEWKTKIETSKETECSNP